jgi:hypothetical protein
MKERRANNKISFRKEPNGSSMGKRINAGDTNNIMMEVENELCIASRHELKMNMP